MVFLRGQQKQHSQRPDAADQSADGPTIDFAPAVVGDDAAEDGVEQMDQRGGWYQRAWLDVGSDDEKSGKVSEQLIEIHGRLLTLRLIA